ncbi:MAG: hypothetical protein IKP58_02855 [Victivallales bacterium]|nr:hypothetical protein [Victivallales bacterium]
MDIEGFAVGALLQRLAYVNNIQAFVSLRDKEPLWDGNIYVYKDENKTRDDINRIPIQVKGRLSKRKTKKETVSYSIKTEDLKSYAQDGGILLFVVDVPELQSIKADIKILYAQLLPYEIRDYLDKAGKQQTFSVPLSKFPISPILIKRLITSTVIDRQKQAGYFNIPAEKLEEYKIIGKNSFTFECCLDKNTKNFLKDMTDLKPYLYAKRSDGTPVPIGRGGMFKSAEIKQKLVVSINDHIFYNEYIEKHDISGEKTLYFGEGIVFNFEPSTDILPCNVKGHFNCEYKGTLNQQIKDTMFYCNAIKNNGFEIAGKKCEIQISTNSGSVLEEMNHKLMDFQRLREALDLAGYPNDLSIVDFDDKTWFRVDDFIAVFVDKKSPNFKLPIGTYFCRISFGQTTFVLLVCKDDTTCNIYNPYTYPLTIYGEDEKGDQHPLSPFILFDLQLLLSVTYLNFDIIWENLQNVEMSEIYHGYVTNLMLRMIMASDKLAPLHKELLDFSYKIAQWLYDNDKTNNHEITLLNIMQIKRRLGKLTREDLNKLYTLLDNSQMSNMNKTGLFIILEDYEKAKTYFEKMSKQEQNSFLVFPIMHLWNDKNKPELKEIIDSVENCNKSGES